ncbi:copper homeostasis protein CutC [Cellulomonas biazotea]|uniref:PF03932 family protein CutC n=1 Tax=Cellulomonas biazotea TaxID=1709 RepID=A0A402DV14_9CELL|nr:copper homeostasis protein CutC [Cellulomonas biazotea]GCE77973.1 copper homeostasis protein CutC [Cellulomonas biazotea]
MSPAPGAPVLEVAVQDVGGAVAAVRCGADRLELCSALAATGGLTPSRGLLDGVVAALATHAALDAPLGGTGRSVGVHVLVRPRPGGFVYDADEVDVQVRDVRAAVAAGAAGVVVGALDAGGAVDVGTLRRLVDAADGRDVTFHRAVDVAADPRPVLDTLRACGVVRVLTSGGAARAADGTDRLAAMVAHADRRVQVMAGGGVRPADVSALVALGVDAVHLSASRHVAADGGPGGGGGDGYTTTDPDVVAAARAALDAVTV